MLRNLIICIVAAVLAFAASAQAEVLTTDNVQIQWKVTNRFRLFRDESLFAQQEKAWSDYRQHLAESGKSDDEAAALLQTSSVLGSEHVLNDRSVPFTNELRRQFDWRGWAAKAVGDTCYDWTARRHSACGGVEAYVNPKAHEIEISLKPVQDNALISEYICHWHVGDNPDVAAPCDQPIRTTIAYPEGATISVNVDGERAISTDIKVKDLLIVGLGDSFASGEGNPDVPVKLDAEKRVLNLYPARAVADRSGSAQWLDKLCHRSLYSYQLRAALQIGIENPHAAVTFLGHACSGAAVEKGIIGPQAYNEFRSDDSSLPDSHVTALSGSKSDGEMARLLGELCKTAPVVEQGLWVCPGQQFRRKVDLVFVSIGGNDIGFANLVSWATLRVSPITRLASWLGATTSPEQFAANMSASLPQAYQRLARQLEKAIPLRDAADAYDPSRVILTAYPDILADEQGAVCKGATDDGQADSAYAANQSLDRFTNWLVVRQDKLDAAHAQLESLYKRMWQLADANGWTFAGRAHTDRPFKGHGFCAQRQDRLNDPAEMLVIPCWGKAGSATQTCQSGVFGKGNGWRPYNPAAQNFPYALRQRWVRTINDATMVINQKVIDRNGVIDEAASARDFTETTGAMHPSAEGHAALADAMLIDLRPTVATLLEQE